MTTTTASFGQTQFGAAALGHRKRTECLVKIADLIHRHPGGTLPEKLHAPKDYKAMDRLMNRPEVTHASVLAAPCARTLERMRVRPGVTLVLHDTTELDYSGLRSITDLGSIGGDLNRGYLCHNSLAYDPQQGEVLGLVHQILHRRRCQRKAKGTKKKREAVKRKRERADRESRLWVRGATAVGTAPVQCQWVHVADRGADTFEFMAHLLQRQPQGFVVRACSKRMIIVGHDASGPKVSLKPTARALPRTGSCEVQVPAKPGQSARTTRVSIGATPILLCPPHVRRGEYDKEPLALWLVCVREDQPPEGLEPLEWILLTNVPVSSEADAWERAEWYKCRWVLEEYHKAQKTGCAIERLQFASSQALQPMIGLLSVVAVSLLKLREAARRSDAQKRRAAEVVDGQYVRVLSAWRLGKPKLDWCVHDFFFALARLGGHQNRKSDHRPGWIVLWKGWMALQHMIDGARAVGHGIRG